MRPYNTRANLLRDLFGFRLFRFRSPLLTESLLFSFPWATWMFRFAQFPTRTVWCKSLLRGDYSIRKPPDQRMLDSSPTNIAADCVLLRLLLPRHPPLALIKTKLFKTFSSDLHRRAYLYIFSSLFKVPSSFFQLTINFYFKK